MLTLSAHHISSPYPPYRTNKLGVASATAERSDRSPLSLSFRPADVDECQIPGSCSQTCINTKGSFKCECLDGYMRDPADHTFCKAVEVHASLLLTHRCVRGPECLKWADGKDQDWTGRSWDETGHGTA